MKTYTYFASLLLFMASKLVAQPGAERLLLLTDRGYYISGETIYYTAFYQGPGKEDASDWSKVLYVELVLPNGSSLGQHKINIESSQGIGQLGIPEGISSGTYYLKAYTRWMRECGPEAFSYTSIQVYDPIQESILPVDTSGWQARTPPQMLMRAEPPSGEVDVVLEKFSFLPREQVHVQLNSRASAPSVLSVSVAKTGLHGEQRYYSPGCRIEGAYKNIFLPETKGLTLTGQAVSAVDQSPAAYATIYVSVLGKNREFFCNYSDSAGRFYFSFPGYVNDRDLFVSTYHPEHGDLELLIDRDFNNDPLSLPSPAATLKDSLASLVTEMSVNFQVAKQYDSWPLPEPEEEEKDARFFYGHPSSTVVFDDFISLPRLEEYFTEVIPQVTVRKTRGVKRLVVLGEHPDLQIYQPLVMIDGVAIFDVEAVLAVSPRLIERVEIVNAPYIRGNVTFGGIISLVSRNNDLGYIDLPSSGLLVSYQMLDPDPKDSILSVSADPRLPDVRNTLYWNPTLALGAGMSTDFNFFTSDASGDYEILLRGMDEAGNYISESVTFRVQ